MFASALRRPCGRTTFTFIAAAATLALVACGAGGDISGPAGPPSDNIFGTWVLESVSENSSRRGSTNIVMPSWT
jgi:hypothetical protein